MEDKRLDRVDKPVHVRLARLLLMLKETHGKPAGRAILVQNPELLLRAARLSF